MDKIRFGDALFLLDAACWAVYDEESNAIEQGFPDVSVWDAERALILHIKALPDERIPASTGSRVGDAIAVCELAAQDILESPDWLTSKVNKVAVAFMEDGYALPRRTLLEQSQKAVWILLDHYRDISLGPDHLIPEDHPLNAPIEHTAFNVPLSKVVLSDSSDRYQAFEAVLHAVETRFPIQVGGLRSAQDFQWQADYAVLSVLLQERRSREMFDRAQAAVLHRLRENKGKISNAQAWSLCVEQASGMVWEDQAHTEFEMRRKGELDPAFRCDNGYDAKRLFLTSLKQKVLEAANGDGHALSPLAGM